MKKHRLTPEQIAAFEADDTTPVPMKNGGRLTSGAMTAPQAESCKTPASVEEQTHTIEHDALMATVKPSKPNRPGTNKPQPKTPDQPAAPKLPTVPGTTPNKVPGVKPNVNPKVPPAPLTPGKVNLTPALYVQEGPGKYRLALQEEIDARASIGQPLPKPHQVNPQANGVKRDWDTGKPIEVAKPELLFDGTDLEQGRFDKDQLMVINKQDLQALAESLKIPYRKLGMNGSSLRFDICKALGWSTAQRPAIIKES